MHPWIDPGVFYVLVQVEGIFCELDWNPAESRSDSAEHRRNSAKLIGDSAEHRRNSAKLIGDSAKHRRNSAKLMVIPPNTKKIPPGPFAAPIFSKPF